MTRRRFLATFSEREGAFTILLLWNVFGGMFYNSILEALGERENKQARRQTENGKGDRGCEIVMILKSDIFFDPDLKNPSDSLMPPQYANKSTAAGVTAICPLWSYLRVPVGTLSSPRSKRKCSTDG